MLDFVNPIRPRGRLVALHRLGRHDEPRRELTFEHDGLELISSLAPFHRLFAPTPVWILGVGTMRHPDFHPLAAIGWSRVGARRNRARAR